MRFSTFFPCVQYAKFSTQLKNVCLDEGEIENGRGNNLEQKLNELNEHQVNSKKKEGTV